MAKRALIGLWVVLAGCDAHVVDAVSLPTTAGPSAPAPTTSVPPAPPPLNPLSTSLFHRYSFDGEGEVARDSKGGAHGQVIGTQLVGDGLLALAGERSGQYVNLPNDIVSGLGDATFEAWLTWSGGGAWQRIFDFGSSTLGEDMPSAGGSYLFLTTATALDTTRTLRATYSQNGVDDEELCNAADAFPVDVATHVALVIDRAAESMQLYQDGALLADCELTRPLSAIDDVNNWLGHSNFVADVDLAGTFDEFRIYDSALSAAELAESFAAGPNAGR